MHDFSLHSGERQTGASYEEIRADHRFRYEWADARIPRDAAGLDAFCGNGYGTWLLGKSRTVTGIDGSAEAIAFARRHYGGPSHGFVSVEWPFPLASRRLGFVVSLESIEHVPDGEAMFAALASALKPGGDIVFSTPNADRLPIAGFRPFHHRHFTLDETLGLARTNGLDVIAWAGQEVYAGPGRLVSENAMRLRAGEAGQFTIVHARRPA
jgi:2-polyprenyl-3-methyl-5-hydroxy-6-metoxy-1,4-benzoquinol methylase